MNYEVKRVIMAVGAHADDIEAKVGATLIKYHDLNYDIVYVMATNNMSGSVSELQADGTITRFYEAPELMMARRKRECDDAAKVLGATPIHLDHPQKAYFTGNGDESISVCYGSLRPDCVPPNVPVIETACDDAASISSLADLILEKDPECIFTHGTAQFNIEHIATCLLVTRAFWKAVEQGYEGGLLLWQEAQTLFGDHSCQWETHVDGTGYLDRKMELMALHRSQMPTALQPNCGWRLISEWQGKVCGCKEMAEVFTWVRRPTRTSRAICNVKAPIMGELTMELIQNSR